MSDPSARKILEHLLRTRYVGVLTTSRDMHPYACLIGFAVTEDYRELVFATPRQTTKYANLTANPNVAMLIDDRANDIADIRGAAAATAIGTAEERDRSERAEAERMLLARHPHLEEFARARSTALVGIAVRKYVVVSRFQTVVEISV